MAEPVIGEITFSSEWKWSGLSFDRDGETVTLVLGAPDVMIESGCADPGRRPHRPAGGRDRCRPAGGGTDPDPRPPCRSGPRTVRPQGLEPIALVVLEENLRPGVTETLELMRSEDVALKLISGDARATVVSVAAAVGIPAGRRRGSRYRVAGGPRGAGPGRAGEHDLLPDQAGAEEAAGQRAVGSRLLHGDDRRRSQRRAGTQERPHGGGNGLRQPGDQIGRRRGAAQGRVRAAAGGGRRRPADRAQHPPARSPLPDQDGLRRGADPAGLGPRLRLPLPAASPDPGGAPDHRHPVLRTGPGTERRAALPWSAAARSRGLRTAGRTGHGARLDPLLLPDRQGLRRQHSRTVALPRRPP